MLGVNEDEKFNVSIFTKLFYFIENSTVVIALKVMINCKNNFSTI